MAKLAPIIVPDPTLDALRLVEEQRAVNDEPRTYLGMSAIGHACDRWLWYSFRLAVREQFACDTLWRFEDGHRSEDVMAARLAKVPDVKLRTIDPRTGQQFAFVDLGGHFRGHCDGLIEGLYQAPKTLHVWEGKATNEKKQADLIKAKSAHGEKFALAQWDPTYYAQAIVYMAYAEVDRHYLTCSSPGARTMVSVRTNADLDHARKLREKAERIITAPEPLPRMTDDPAWYQCKWCAAHSVCHGGKLPAVNCRTCAHATPEMDGDGRWSCARWNRDLSKAEQLKGCDQHRYIPALVTFAAQVDADADANWVEYRMPDGRTFRNGTAGPDSYTSEELRVVDPALIGDAATEALRAAFDARHVEAA